MQDFKNNEIQNEEDKNKKRRIIFIIILIILLLLLLTSCTSNFWGKIGDLFRNEGNFTIDDNTNNPEIILNKDLRFSADAFEVYVGDSKVKLSYFYKNINPSEIICSTSDANIATCYVQDDYVVINPKQAGIVDIILQAETNGKIYKALAKLEVKPQDQKIHFFQDSDTININFTNQKVFSFELEGVTGRITVTSSDETIAKAEVRDGLIVITPIRPGKVYITVTIETNGKTIVKVYELIITGDPNPSKPNGGNGNNSGGNNNTNKPTNPDKPNVPSQDSNSLLSNLTISSGKLNFNSLTYNYQVGVDANVSKVTLVPTLSSNKATATYSFNGKTVASLNDLELNVGDNVVIITVTAEDGTVSVYKVVINRASEKDNTLSNITIDQGSLYPTFDKNIVDYHVTVESNVDEVNMTAKPSKDTSKVEYIYNGQTVDSLDHLKLNTGKNTVQIVVTGEDGSKRTYTVVIDKKSSDDNTLSKLVASGHTLNETFESNRYDYTLNVPYVTDKLTMAAEATDPRSTISYTLNGEKINDLNNMPLKEGDNELKITVTSQSGKDQVYTVIIHRPVRSITVESPNHVISFENTPYPVVFNVLEDGNITSDYDIKDIQVKINGYQGTYEIKKDYILMNPNVSMKDKSVEMEIYYQNKVVKTNLKFEMNDYELRPEKNSYDIDFVDGHGKGNIILNTNMFNYGTTITNIPGGIRISSTKDPRIFVDVTTNANFVQLSSTSENDKVSSLAIQVDANHSGVANIKVTGSAFGYSVGTYDINVNVIAKYEVNIYANGGFFNEDILEYHFKITNLDTIKLEDYVPYKESASGNCMYYTLEKYNTKMDGTGTDYLKNAIISNLNNNLDLYAIYSSNDSYIELVLPYKYYLTDVDLFHNEEYFKAYGKDKVIYPGAHGSYVMTFDNETSKEIVITGINLEEDTICIEGKGCLNMGYVIKHSPKEATNYTYYYGSSTQHTILNKDAQTIRNGIHTERNIVFEPSGQIKIPSSGAAEISLLWEWVDQDDILDTLIGNEAANLNDRYVLYVSLDFTKLHSHCTVN